MKPYRRWAAIIAAAVVLLTAAGCLPAAGEETPVSTSALTRPPNGPCGDGVCDDTELQDPALCPQDCPSPTETPAQAAEERGRANDRGATAVGLMAQLEGIEREVGYSSA